MQPDMDFRERQERELKFTAAGWKRDCQGKWFTDENVSLFLFFFIFYFFFLASFLILLAGTKFDRVY